MIVQTQTLSSKHHLIQVRIASEVVDFSSTTNAATDTFDIIGIPANTVVLAAGFDVFSAGTGTGTIAVGDC